ncbi:hypothetical protein AVEN_184949-1 [Araneus ventricosus]|uniref:Uncharacterized protein n=1 Tax=Araneus ventricosus TaxID=182803 RepID=A0A4Y2QT95_ARAVE|nr:hypothetical protein AVEN_184949-1 [Araneus ventricosus]
MAFLNTLKDGLPIDPLPPKRPRDNSVPHAPVRNTHLTPEEEQLQKSTKSHIRKKWPLRTKFIPGTKNISHEPLVNPQCDFLPPLRIKLGLIDIFVKALYREGVAFLHLRNKFKSLSDAKVKEEMFIGPQIKAVFRDEEFEKKTVRSRKSSLAGIQISVHTFPWK